MIAIKVQLQMGKLLSIYISLRYWKTVHLFWYQ